MPKSVTTSAPAISSSCRLGQFFPISLRNMLFGIFGLIVSWVRQEPFTAVKDLLGLLDIGYEDVTSSFAFYNILTFQHSDF